MGAISSIHCASSGATANLADIANLLRGGEVGQSAAGRLGGMTAGGASAASSVAGMQSTLAELIQSGGSAAQSDQLMRTLLTVIVLLALLDQSQRTSDAVAGALTALALNTVGRSLQTELASSSTSVSIQQTTLNVSMSGQMDYTQVSFGASYGTGGQIDATA